MRLTCILVRSISKRRVVMFFFSQMRIVCLPDRVFLWSVREFSSLTQVIQQIAVLLH